MATPNTSVMPINGLVAALTTSSASTSRYGNGCAGSGAPVRLDGAQAAAGRQQRPLELVVASPLAPCARFVGHAGAAVPIDAGCNLLLAAPQGIAPLLTDIAAGTDVPRAQAFSCRLAGNRRHSRGTLAGSRS